MKPETTFTFATDGEYSEGPAEGEPLRLLPPFPGQGFPIDEEIKAEHVAAMLGICGDWLTHWLAAGTSDRAETAHLVETDRIGKANVARLRVGEGTEGGPQPSMLVSAPAGGGGEVLILTNTVSADPCLVVHHSVEGEGPTVDLRRVNGAGAVLRVASMDSHDGPALVIERQGISRLPWATIGGMARRFGESAGESVAVNDSPQVKVELAFGEADELREGATMHLRATCTVGTDVAAAGGIQLGLRDVTEGDFILTREVRTFHPAASATECTATLEADYVLPASGPRTFALAFRSDASPNVGYIANATLEVRGQYD